MNKTENIDRRIKRTRQLLKDALISLIMEKDFELITVQDITSRADVNRATFYSHYHSKHDLLEQTINEILEEFSEAVRYIPEAKKYKLDETTKPYSIFVRMFEQISKHADFYKTMLSKRGRPGFWRRMVEILRESVYQRQLNLQPDDRQLIVPKDLLSTYASSSYLGLIIYWLESGMSYTPEYMASQLTQLTNLGIFKAAGLDKRNDGTNMA
ncbi:TetR/AcrR family transcriptional regulator C-terminal domain-containing protein [Bacillus songklensis]|uniref:TetR/AcrR family transcriptional regulator C-terminal domain-containing protein n=1 Tax=Bacillus songklensis TaxID=1069116 RepID=A0ABV8AZT5_9BACI